MRVVLVGVVLEDLASAARPEVVESLEEVRARRAAELRALELQVPQTMRDVIALAGLRAAARSRLG